MNYVCDDGSFAKTIEADSAEEAAQEYVDSGDWGDSSKTEWIDVYVYEEDAGEDTSERITITLEPEEPKCTGKHGHDWRSPIEVVGGIKEAPGVYGHGGGVRITEVCQHCGWYQITDTWAQRRDTGEQGLESTEYSEPTDASLEWIKSLNEDQQ